MGAFVILQTAILIAVLVFLISSVFSLFHKFMVNENDGDIIDANIVKKVTS